MPSLLLVAATTGYQTREFARAADKLGFDLTLATDRCHILEDPWRDRAIPVRFDGSTPEIQGWFDGILAVGDGPARTAARIAQRLGLPFHSPASADACANKLRSRRLLRDAGVPVPQFFTLEESPVFPAVLKPADRSGSQGVVRVDGPSELQRERNRVARISPNMIVEEFIPGVEYAVEALITDGHFHLLAIFDKPDPLDGPYFEESIYVTPTRATAKAGRAIADAVARAAAALGLSDGAIHAEVRYNKRGPWLLEVAARPIGGLCSRALRFRDGITYEELLLRHAAHEDVSEIRRDPAACGVMMIPVPGEGILQSVEGVKRALRVKYLEDIVITAKVGEHLIPFPDGSSYPGFIFSRAPHPAQAEAALRTAHRRLLFNLSTVLPQIR